MRSLQSIARHTSEGSVEQVIAAFESHCAQGETSLKTFWEGRTVPAVPATLAVLIKLDLQRRFDRGERPRVAEYLELFPSLSERDDRVVSLIYEEFCLRQDSGEFLDPVTFCDGYAPWRDSLLLQLAYHRDLSQAVGLFPPPPTFPTIGEVFGQYTLEKVIGKGSLAQVYLATEAELGDRQVVIKVSASLGQEPTIQGRLDHPNIVPIFSITRSDSGLQGICMPYRPGLTLEDLIKQLGRGSPPQKARVLWNHLIPIKDQLPSTLENRRSGWDEFPVRGSFAEAVAWIGLALADALAYLHEKGVIHRDIKPANILLAHREGPQLLDFNLAENPESSQNVSQTMKGGTLPYMAPEHLRAFLEASAWKEVGRSADLYSLGLVLRELLTGQAPELPGSLDSMPRVIRELIVRRSHPFVSSRDLNPLIPPSLDAILEKCLAFEPVDRYASATQLAEDLTRFLDRRPLQYAENSSKAERGANWLFRNRFLALSALMTCNVFLFYLVWRTPIAIPDRSDFRRAVNQYHSALPTDWEAARKSFVQLRREVPNSAWPTFYLAMTLEKQDEKNQGSASLLIKDAVEKSDAEEVLLELLKKNPDSAMLLMNYGNFLLKKTRTEEARRFLTQSLRVNPNQIMALGALVNLERTAKNYDRVLELISRQVEVAIKLDLGWNKVYAFRNTMLPVLVILTDQSIERISSPDDRRLVVRHLDAIESTLEKMTEDQQAYPIGRGVEMHGYIDGLYRGFVASARGVLTAETHDLSLARTWFDRADQHYQRALAGLSARRLEDKSYLAPLAKHRGILKIRREKALAP